MAQPADAPEPGSPHDPLTEALGLAKAAAAAGLGMKLLGGLGQAERLGQGVLRRSGYRRVSGLGHARPALILGGTGSADGPHISC